MLRQTATAVCSLALFLAIGWTPAGASLLQTIGKADYYNGADKVGTYNLIYDPDAPDTVNGGTHGVAWLDYTYYDGWQNSKDWASGLNGGGTITNYVLNTGYRMNWNGSWRLPSTIGGDSPGDYPPLPTSSEMAHLYYAEDVGAWRASPFELLKMSPYFSGTEYTAQPGTAWTFDFYGGRFGGGQNPILEYSNNYAMAVRSGELESAPAVPEPSTYALFCIGLGAVGFFRKKTVKSEG